MQAGSSSSNMKYDGVLAENARGHQYETGLAQEPDSFIIQGPKPSSLSLDDDAHKSAHVVYPLPSNGEQSYFWIGFKPVSHPNHKKSISAAKKTAKIKLSGPIRVANAQNVLPVVVPISTRKGTDSRYYVLFQAGASDPLVARTTQLETTFFFSAFLPTTKDSARKKVQLVRDLIQSHLSDSSATVAAANVQASLTNHITHSNAVVNVPMVAESAYLNSLSILMKAQSEGSAPPNLMHAMSRICDRFIYMSVSDEIYPGIKMLMLNDRVADEKEDLENINLAYIEIEPRLSCPSLERLVYLLAKGQRITQRPMKFLQPILRLAIHWQAKAANVVGDEQIVQFYNEILDIVDVVLIGHSDLFEGLVFGVKTALDEMVKWAKLHSKSLDAQIGQQITAKSPIQIVNWMAKSSDVETLAASQAALMRFYKSSAYDRHVKMAEWAEDLSDILEKLSL